MTLPDFCHDRTMLGPGEVMLYRVAQTAKTRWQSQDIPDTRRCARSRMGNWEQHVAMTTVQS